MLAAGGIAAVCHLCMCRRSVTSPTPDVFLWNHYKKQLNVENLDKRLNPTQVIWTFLLQAFLRVKKIQKMVYLKWETCCLWQKLLVVYEVRYRSWCKRQREVHLHSHVCVRCFYLWRTLLFAVAELPVRKTFLSWGLDGGLPLPSRASYSLPDLIWRVSLDKMPLTNSEICRWHSSLLALPFLFWQDN